MSSCKDRVVIITGAGGGLGRAYAKSFAEEGAKVVVNDIRLDAAQAVVDDIVAAGGDALANAGDITSMAGAKAIVDAVLEHYGDVHVLVNNAGVCRDKMFVNLTEEDWDVVMNVHLKGHFCLANTLARYWRDRKKAGFEVDARIINTSSGAGLQGSVGQSNYSAAKAGILGLTLVQATELARYGITANALAPNARTGMTEGVFAEMMKKPEDGSFDVWDPYNGAPIVTWLGSSASRHVSGKVFEFKGGWLSVSEGWRTGPAQDKGARWQAEELTEVVNGLIAESRPAQPVYGA